MSAAGKWLEAEIKAALDTFRAWHWNFENTGTGSHKTKQSRPADKLAILPPDGRGCLIECKEVKSCSRLAFNAVEPHQEKNLYNVARTGAMALVATAYKERNRWHVLLMHYTDFAHLRRTLGRESIPLAGPARPACLVELKKIETPDAGNVWDLRSALVALESRQAAPLYPMTPTQERRGF